MAERMSFGFVESPEGTGDAPLERKLVGLEAPATLQVDRMAERIAVLLEQDRRGAPRLEETAIQNTIIRSRYHGDIPDPRKFETALISAVQDRTQRQASREVQRMLAGTEAVLGSIRASELEFARARVERLTLRQFIGLNDTLDARHAIDFVDIRYEPEFPLRATEVALIQAKRGTITEEEREEIHEVHQTYYTDRLASFPHVEQHERTAFAVAEVAREVGRDEGLARATALELLTAEGHLAEVSGTVAEKIGRPSVWVTCFLRSRDAREVLAHAARVLAENAQEHQALGAAAMRLSTAARAHELPLHALRALFPAWAFNSRFVAVTSFTSVVDAGGTRTTKHLSHPGDAPKALTAST